MFCVSKGAHMNCNRTEFAGEITAQEALREALLNLKAVCAHMKTTFQKEVAEKREETAHAMET